MMPEEWPIAALASDQNAPARAAGRGRLATVRADFFLDPAKRLSEQERALMTAMLHCLVGDVADELRATLPSPRQAANDPDNARLTDRLSRSGLLDIPELVEMLLRRAEEFRISAAATSRGGRREARVLQGLVSNDHGAVSAAAMALILARGRRRDRFGQCLIAFDDLSPALAAMLANRVAAALRDGVSADAATADSELAAATAKLLASHQPERSADRLAANLVELLDDHGSLSDDLVLAAGQEGELAFVGEVLARRAGLPGSSVQAQLLSGEMPRVIALLRVAGCSRALAAGLLAGVGDLIGIEDAGEAIALFDSMSESAVTAARAWLGTTDDYRDALDALEQAGG
jgi:hypothetical protein